jgi:hypothetical protein
MTWDAGGGPAVAPAGSDSARRKHHPKTRDIRMPRPYPIVARLRETNDIYPATAERGIVGALGLVLSWPGAGRQAKGDRD